MPKYLIGSPAFIGGIYYPASNTDQREIDLPDGTPPSRTWTPLDDAARRDLVALTSPDLPAAPKASDTNTPDKTEKPKKSAAPKASDTNTPDKTEKPKKSAAPKAAVAVAEEGSTASAGSAEQAEGTV